MKKKVVCIVEISDDGSLYTSMVGELPVKIMEIIAGHVLKYVESRGANRDEILKESQSTKLLSRRKTPPPFIVTGNEG